MKTEKCPTCNGTGEAFYSCCTNDPVDSDMPMCPVCKEHLGEETCETCEGSGVIPVDQPNIPQKINLIAQAEARVEAQRDWVADMVNAGHNWSLD